MTVRSDGYIEKLFVNKTGQHVEKGETLFRFYSSQIQLAQADFMVAMRAQGASSKSEAERSLAGAMQKLRNLDVPDSRIDEVRTTMTNPRTIDWASPATGDIVEKKVIEGQRVAAGDELFRIADHCARLGDRRGGRSRYRRNQARYARHRDAHEPLPPRRMKAS